MAIMNEWLVFSLILLGIWLIIFLLKKSIRKKMFLVSLFTMPFGLTEPLFVPEYWDPPSLFNLAANTGFDIESLIFSFAIMFFLSSCPCLEEASRSSIPTTSPDEDKSTKLYSEGLKLMIGEVEDDQEFLKEFPTRMKKRKVIKAGARCIINLYAITDKFCRLDFTFRQEPVMVI